MKAPSGDQLGIRSATVSRYVQITHLSLRKKVDFGDRSKGLAILRVSAQVSVSHTFTVLSSD
jgi:hypothetical protein